MKIAPVRKNCGAGAKRTAIDVTFQNRCSRRGGLWSSQTTRERGGGLRIGSVLEANVRLSVDPALLFGSEQRMIRRSVSVMKVIRPCNFSAVARFFRFVRNVHRMLSPLRQTS